MNKLLKLLRDMFARKSKDAILIKACREGNPHAVKAALKAGANPNAWTYMGEYAYSPWVYETQYTGTVHITPLLLAATSAQGKDESRYYQVIQLLANHPKTDLDFVVQGHKKEWRSEQHHADGYQPDYEEDYKASLREALNQQGRSPFEPANQPADFYQVSPQMSSFLLGILTNREEKEHETQQAFSYLVDGLVAHEKYKRERLLAQALQARDQKITSL